MVGAGHAGIEAALACARMGLRTACITLRRDRIGHLPCNCSIGGPAKGHLAREVDALGGQMGVTTDFALTHIRRVGTSKGPAIQTLRAHVCKTLYPSLMQAEMAAQPNLTILEGRALRAETQEGRVSGVLWIPAGSEEVQRLDARALVLTTGTFLNGLCHEGRQKTVAARSGDASVSELSEFLHELGVRLRRFKTGTTPRVALSSLDLSCTPELPSEPEAGALSFLHTHPSPRQALLPCWQTRTTEATHTLIRENLGQSAMYSGQIEGIGPRYCPSIEDKVVRFADKTSHPIFLEKEEWESESIYVQGVSTSLPAAVQLDALRTIPGLAQVEMLRPGYAVEYDMADPLQLDARLMSKLLPGLFLAGQLNGTSGYEEAAGQGIVAGINAARWARDLPPIDFPRSESFLGVMIDDLVTKGVEDPYRMLTARAEHRLHLRHDNADRRLTPLSREIGLCDEKRWTRFAHKEDAIERGLRTLRETSLSPAQNSLLIEEGWNEIKNRTPLFDLMKRPGARLTSLAALAERCGTPIALPLDAEAIQQVELAAMYDGYLQRQNRLIERTEKLESLAIPESFDFEGCPGLSYESREKLTRVRPATVGQASRVPGVRMSDIALLIGRLR